jgi:KaiC/GvpD/RAD55 family RecA-like ATPase
LSEIVFGLVLSGTIDAKAVESELLVYPYNAALADVGVVNEAELSTRYGAEAIHAAMQAAKSLNGIAPEQYLHELARVYRDFRVVNTMQRTARRIENNEAVDFEELKQVIDSRLQSAETKPWSWQDTTEDFKTEWLWAGWIPFAEMTLLVGIQGSGKSALALQLADSVANGRPLPDGSHVAEQLGVLWVETEGRQGENIRRARHMGIDTKNIYGPAEDMRRVMDITKVEDKALIRAHAMRPEIGLVVIDSLGGAMMNENEATAKKVLQDLARMAQETSTTFLVIHHLRKQDPKAKSRRVALDDVRGHGGITQFSPSVIAIDYDGLEGPRFLTHLKMNLAKAQSALTFSIGSMGIEWAAATSDVVARAAMDALVVFIENLVADGPMNTAEVRKRIEAEGYTLEQLRRATSGQYLEQIYIDGIAAIVKKN